MTEIQKQWVAALRSGEYKQGNNALRRDDEFCCLGVLCDLAVKAGVATQSVRGNSGFLEYKYSSHKDASSSVLPTGVQEWSGMKNSHGMWGDEKKKEMLTAMNDGGVSFDKIADFIEQHPEKLFV